MKNMKNSKKREDIIKKMLEIVQYDSPWIWGYHPKSFSLSHKWVENIESNLMANNTLKYKKINNSIRKKDIKVWNKANFSLLYIVLFLVTAFIASIFVMIRKKDKEKIYD